MHVPPFHENFDDVHCMECCLRGIIEYFEPANPVTWQDIDTISNKQPGKWSWPQFATKNMLDRGYEVKRISWGSAQDVVDKGVRQYLIDLQGEEAAEISMQNSVSIKEIEDACRALIAHPNQNHQKRIPVLEDIRSFLDKEYLVISMVNAKALNGKERYAGHSVLIYALDDEYIYMHDSGLPPKPERKVTHDDFLAAATSPKETNWSLAAYKL